jgi:hypothetical protein
MRFMHETVRRLQPAQARHSHPINSGEEGMNTNTLPTIHETTFGGFVKAIYGYAGPNDAADAGDNDVAEMIDWTMRDPKGPQIGWGEHIYYWANDDDHEVLWRHKPTIDDLDSYGDLTPEAIERRRP